MKTSKFIWMLKNQRLKNHSLKIEPRENANKNSESLDLETIPEAEKSINISLQISPKYNGKIMANIKGIIVGICNNITDFIFSKIDKFLGALFKILRNSTSSTYFKRQRPSFARIVLRPHSKNRYSQGFANA